MRISTLIGIFTFIYLSVFSQEARWESIELSREIPRTISREAMEQELLAEARAALIERVAGIGVRKVESLKTSERMVAKDGQRKTTTDWYEDYIYYTRQESAGRIIEEKAPEFREQVESNRPYLLLRLEALVALDDDSSDPGFTATIRTNQPTYRDKDPFRLEATATRDAALYLFSVSADGICTLIWPNKAEPNNEIKANELHTIPRDPEMVSFVALLPEATGGSASQGGVVQEMLFGLFYRGDEPLFDPAMAFSNTWTLPEINKIILRIPRKARTEVLEIYQIVD